MKIIVDSDGLIGVSHVGDKHFVLANKILHNPGCLILNR